MSIDWDIDSYKTEFETDEHWELKKRFMLTHKDKFPEDELVCLAQVFTNIEFMGCRYPDETMKRVAYLARGVVEDFREKKKNSLKRTFVAASDAASAKVKGLKAHQEANPMSDPYPDSDLNQPKAKNRKIDKIKPKDSSQRKKVKKSSESHSKEEIERTSEPQLQLEALNTLLWSAITNTVQNLLNQINVRTSVLDNFVVVYFNERENPLGILTRSVSANNYHMSWSHENANSSGKKSTKLFLNGELIATGEGVSLKQCKRQAAEAALVKLKENCFGIKLNQTYQARGVCDRDFVIRSESNILTKNNIGCKLMILMGWKGGGLGRQEQGIKEPITSNMLAPREGLGAKPDLSSFKRRAESFLRDWVKSDSKDDLVFTSDFTSEERKELHILAHSFSLRSKSQGKKNNRRLLISKTQHPLEIVKDLLKGGGSSNKFNLVYPGKLSPNPPGRNRGRNN